MRLTSLSVSLLYVQYPTMAIDHRHMRYTYLSFSRLETAGSSLTLCRFTFLGSTVSLTLTAAASTSRRSCSLC